ncbi:exocyst complex component 3-like protein isoform X1 [Nerophis ophidion]|uniref:exocyst complex component 3-like protein isoform X1 n=1 Tax=Nerophis ophidion TaxID=159077 RepID=UPI002ADF7E17|nr:exocyst complex component 3-like protein isoform X1 [Nerophis ophidion]XP_061775980.1 exocyst complex component 3-like protein isoform X1 [Nerophis ophidion]
METLTDGMSTSPSSSSSSSSSSADDRASKTEDYATVMTEVWPEAERAESLARGAALKWASGVFCRPEHLEQVSQYRKRESRRTTSIYTRLKSMVQSHLEEVGRCMEQLREAQDELRQVSDALKKAGLEYGHNQDGLKNLERLREVSVNHGQLLAAVSNLPRLYSMHSVVVETECLVASQRLLEAHARLMDLERWQDDILWQIHGAAGMAESDQELVAKYFSDVSKLGETLGKELWAVVSSALAVARQNPTPFVSAVRIVEREEAMDRILLERVEGKVQPLPPGRPRRWRARFFQVLEEAVSARFHSVSYLHTRGPGLAGHLSALQHTIMADLATVRHLLENCVPPHYCLTRAYLRASHHCLHAHLTQVCSWDLESGEIFAVLNWVLHVYNSPQMLSHPDVLNVLKGGELGLLISTEGLEQLQNKYVQSVRKSVSAWMQKALQVELQDWQRDQEPDTDHEGFYTTSLPTIIIQMLEENARVAFIIGQSLRDQTIQMGLYEMENLLNRFREALVEFGKRHRSGPSNSNNHFYLHYLLASISNCIVLKKGTESLQQQQSSRELGQFTRTPSNPLAALERTVRRACRMVIDQLLLDLKPFLTGLVTRHWMVHGDPVPKLCRILERHLELYSRVRAPCRQRLQEEAQWLMVVEYVKALMQKRLLCRSADERRKFAQQMVKDDQQFRQLFNGLESDGSAPEVNPMAVLPVLADIIRLKDPSMLPLVVSGLASTYPDISEEQVSVLLDIRGDISRDIRGSVLDLLEQSANPLPVGYRPIFIDILVPPSSMTFCLPSTKCA